MRSFIPALDTLAMPWEPLARPGSFRKTLNTDLETGATTGFVRLQEGAASAPGKPHFHYTDEEILVTQGALTFDHRTWLSSKGYCYHPTGTVHGFHSGFKGDVQFFVRDNEGGEASLNYVEGEPKHDSWYQAFGPEPKRSPAYIADYSALGETARPDGTSSTILSRHTETGEGSLFLRVPPAWKNLAPESTSRFYREIFVVDGDVTATGGIRLGTGFYAFIPPETAYSFETSEAGALIFISFGG